VELAGASGADRPGGTRGGRGALVVGALVLKTAEVLRLSLGQVDLHTWKTKRVEERNERLCATFFYFFRNFLLSPLTADFL